MAEEIMSQLSFDEGMAVPVANEENKKLEYQVEFKQKEIARMRDEVDQYVDRIQSMNDHLKNVRQERMQTQELCNAREREIKTEEHFRQLAEREDGRLRAEIQRLQKELDQLRERRNVYENTIFKNNEKLEQMKGQMNWDQQACDAWLLESAKRDEDALILEKYTKVDEGKLKELALRQEKMIDERNKKRRALEHEITQTLTTQLELDKTAEDFRQAHKERQELLSQWENTIKQMHQRDAEMDGAALQLMELKVDVKKRQDDIKDRQQFLDNEINNNQEKEKKISAAERQAAKLRLEYQNVEQQRIQFQDELETLKYTVDRTAKDLENTRKKCTELKKEVVVKQDKLQTAQQTKDELTMQLKVTMNTAMTAEEKAQQLAKALKKEEVKILEIEKELQRLRDHQFKKTQELHQIRQKETDLTAEIQGAKAASRNLSSKLNKLDQEALKQQEIIYNQDFQLQQLERRMTRLQGERSSEEKALLEAKIKQLSDVLEGHNTRHTLLTAQLKKLGEDLRRANRDLSKGETEKTDLTSKIGELNLHNDSSERELKKITAKRQDLMVDENILKLEIKRLRDQLYDRANDVLTLEERRLLLDTAMKERRQEVKIHTDMLRAQMKASEEERGNISGELHERISKIDKLRKRYEILMVSMAPPEGEEEKSQAYYVIKAAQEKEELQRTGDDLDAKIRKAEKEIRALENTLRLMNSRNETYRKSFSSVEETSEEYEEKVRLEEQLRAVNDKFKYKRRQVKELQEDIQTMSTTLEALTADEQELVGALEDREQRINSMQRELDEQEVKKARAEKMLTKLTKDVRSAQKSKGEVPEERDIAVREMREFNQNIMKQIGEVAHNHPDIGPVVNLYFSQAGLPVPPSPGAKGGSRASSLASSRSSVASFRSVSSSQSIGSGRQSLASLSGRQSVTQSPSSSRQAIGTTTVELGLGDFPPSGGRTPTGTPPGSSKKSSRAGSVQASPASSARGTPPRAPSTASSKGSRTPTARTPSGKKK